MWINLEYFPLLIYIYIPKILYKCRQWHWDCSIQTKENIFLFANNAVQFVQTCSYYFIAIQPTYIFIQSIQYAHRMYYYIYSFNMLPKAISKDRYYDYYIALLSLPLIYVLWLFIKPFPKILFEQKSKYWT